MRKWLIRAGISAFVVSSFVSAGACGGDDLTGVGGGGDDSGGGSDGTTSDVVTIKDSGSGSDAGHDSGKPPGPATFNAVTSSGPLAGAKVVFYDETGAPQPVITTGADGKATMTVSEGWSVTGSVVDTGITTSTTLLSFIDIEPGDNLVMTTRTTVPVSQNIAVDEPTGAVTGTISEVIYAAGCGNNSYDDGTPGVVTLDGQCMHTLGDGGSSFDLLVTAIDSSNNTIAYAQMTGIPYTGATQHVTGLTWSAATNVDVVTTGTTPTSAAGFGAQVAFVSGGHELGSSNTFTQGDAGAPSFTLGTPMGSFANQASFQFAVEYGPMLGGFSYVMHRQLANDSTNYPVDFGTLAPTLESGSLGADDAGGVAFSVTPSAPVASYDGERLVLYFFQEEGDSGLYDTALWNIVSPAAATISPPRLTSDLVSFVPSTSAMFTYGFQIQKVSTIGSYAAYRTGFARYPEFEPDETTPFTLEETGIEIPF